MSVYTNEEINIYDQTETHYNCTVQILRNSITGQMSFGWKPERPTEPGVWHYIGDEQPEDGCYIVLWRAKDPKYPPDRKAYYAMCDLIDGEWDAETDIPQSQPVGGAEILFWMELPERPEIMP